ncbi:MAG: DUF3267 domain-containing protein [Bacteroidales bacterium]|nr:DUF3267 domain-containing protein [Bacteroidales bacterium]
MEKENINLQQGKVYTLSIEKASLRALFLIFPIVILYAIPFYLIWGKNVFGELKFRSLLFLFLFIVLGILLHELLHGIVWAIFSKHGFRSIHFGMKWEYFTPYCHCTESLKVWHYILGGLAPLVFMGILPGIWALFSGNALIMFFAIFFSCAAGGDIQSVWMLRKFRKDQLVFDHPQELGFIVVDESISDHTE